MFSIVLLIIILVIKFKIEDFSHLVFISLISNFQTNFVCKEADMSLHVGL